MSPPMRPITAAILAHLAASPLACAKETPSATSPAPSATSVTTSTETATATASATTSAAPTASAPPSATASAKPSPKLGATCMNERDCGDGLKCVLPFNGAHVIQGQPGHCRPENEPQMGGRPLYVEGVARVSPPVADREWHRGEARALPDAASLASSRAQLERAAFEEHASIAAFARTLCQLLALGAPAWLVDKTQRALADEVSHASRTFEWVERLGGGALGPGPLPEAVAPFSGESQDAIAEHFARDVFRGGCIGETLAAHEAADRAECAPLDALCAFYVEIADDEARHAALAFETVAWLRSRFPSAARAFDEEQARFLATASERQKLLLSPLFDAIAA